MASAGGIGGKQQLMTRLALAAVHPSENAFAAIEDEWERSFLEHHALILQKVARGTIARLRLRLEQALVTDRAAKAAEICTESFKTTLAGTPNGDCMRSKAGALVGADEGQEDLRQHAPPAAAAPAVSCSVPTEDWLEEMTLWLSEEECVSDDNLRRVMRVVRRLATGEGVKHPISMQFFHRGQAVTIDADIEELVRLGKEFLPQDADKSKGWKLDHPLGKLKKFRTPPQGSNP